MGAGRRADDHWYEPISVTVSPLSRLCPPGWTGIVVISDTAIATAPARETARYVQQALSGLAVASLTGLLSWLESAPPGAHYR